MQFEKLINTWLSGEVLQGKIMLLLGIILGFTPSACRYHNAFLYWF